MDFKSQNRLRAVLFDMDGVIVDSESIIEKAAVLFFKERGVAVAGSDFHPFIGTGEARYLGGVAEKYGVVLDLEAAKKRLYEIYFEVIPGQLRPIAGVLDFLGECRASGLKLALATSADASKMNANLREIGLSVSTFDFLINGSQLTHKKPHPEVFLRAAEGVGVPPATCLVVEDALNGVQAGKSAGAKVLGLATTFSEEKLLAAGADFTAKDFTRVSREVLDW